jgi:hypothetical protein
VVFRVLTHPKLGGSKGCSGLIIEPLNVLRNQEPMLSIPNWPPPRVAIAYELIIKGNFVYRVERAELLPGEPEPGVDPPELITGAWHLADALESLGIDAGGAWAGLINLRENNSAHVTAWRL